MNIIKLKDAIMSENNSISGIFNTFLKGRYAYWIQMRYIVPFEFMGHEGYVACEEDITKLLQKADGSYPRPYGCPYIDMYSEDRCIMKYIDMELTDAANSISKFKLENDNVPDGDLTINMLKNFRTWLAQTILDLDALKDSLDNIKLDDVQKHVMEYYANNMYNDVVKYLSVFNSINSFSGNTSCGCCSDTTLSAFTISDCDSLTTYKDNVKLKMVEMFSDISFWTQYPVDFLKKFKQYIDNIIKVGLKINNKEDKYNAYKDCTCSDYGSNSTALLQKLSESLGYMISNEYKQHKNFIYDSFYNWSLYIYEFMQW
jgi:hypothetical protein